MATEWYIEWWHTTQRKWAREPKPLRSPEKAEEAYTQTLDWHYAKTVRIVKVTTEVVKQSKEPDDAPNEA